MHWALSCHGDTHETVSSLSPVFCPFSPTPRLMDTSSSLGQIYVGIMCSISSERWPLYFRWLLPSAGIGSPWEHDQSPSSFVLTHFFVSEQGTSQTLPTASEVQMKIRLYPFQWGSLRTAKCPTCMTYVFKDKHSQKLASGYLYTPWDFPALQFSHSWITSEN